MASMGHVRGDSDGGGVTASSGGVQVRKWVATDAAAVPIVKYELASSREEPVAVTLDDVVPEHLDPDDVGFHEDHHGESWTRPGPDALRFQTTLPPGEEVTTVYGVRRESVEDPSPYLDEPTLDVDLVADDDGGDGETAGDDGESPSSASPDAVDERLERALDDAAASEAVDATARAQSVADHDAADDEDADAAETLSLADPKAADRASEDNEGEDDATGGGAGGAGPTASPGASETAESSKRAEASEPGEPSGSSESADAPGDDGPVWEGEEPEAVFSAADSVPDAGVDGGAEPGAGVADEDGESSAMVEGEGVAASLASELRSTDVDDETKAALARELNLQLSASSSQFVEHLQSRMKEKRGQLEADIERLEDSIAELYGLKADSSALSSVRSETADAERVAALSESVAALEDAKADAAAVAALEADLASLESTAATERDLADARSSLEDRVAALDATVSSVDERAASEEGVEELARGVRDLDDRTPSREAFESLEAAHESLREDHDALAADAAMDADLAGVERELAELDESLSAELEGVESRLVDRVEEEATVREDAVASIESELERVESASATAERVAGVEGDLERRYVTEEDITAALESRLRTSLFARTLLLGAGAAVGAGSALVGTGKTGGVVLVVLGLAALAYWWWLNDSELEEAVDE